jgi:WD40 repeat protein
MKIQTTLSESVDSKPEQVSSSPENYQNGNGRPMFYKAFMSYSHAADGQFARSLQSALQRFARPFYKLRGMRVFRDETSLHLTPELWPRIQQALKQSECFLFLASPTAAKSRWVQDEISEWLTLNDGKLDRLFVILTDGNIQWDNSAGDFNWNETNAIPVTLKGKFRKEPFHLDFRWAKNKIAETNVTDLSLRNPQFLNAVGKVAASIYDRPVEDMVGEDVKQHRIFVTVAICSGVLLLAFLITAIVAAFYAEINRRAAENQARISLSRQLSAQGLTLSNDQLDLALLLSIQALATDDNPESRSGLLGVVSSSPLLYSFLHGHTSTIQSVTFSPDGRLLASGDDDNKIILWDVAGRQPFGAPLVGHSAPLRSLAFSPNGKLLASGGEDKVILWDIASRRQLDPPLLDHAEQFRSVAFSPDGKTLAAGTRQEVFFWDVDSRQKKGQPFKYPGTTDLIIAFSPDGRTVAVATVSDITLLDAETHQRTGKTLKGRAWRTVAFSPDGKQIASGSTEGRPLVWNLATGALTHEFERKHYGFVYSVAFSLDGKMLASAGVDRRIILWDVESGKAINESLSGHSSWIFSIAFSRDGKWLASGGADQKVALWDIGLEEAIGKPLPSSALTSVSFRPDGKLLTSDENEIALWDVKARQAVESIKTGNSGDFSPDGRFFVSFSDDGHLALWDVETGQPLRQNIAVGDTGKGWAVSVDRKTLAVANIDNTISLWDVTKGALIETVVTKHRREINSLAFSPDSTKLASGGKDEQVFLWDVVKRQAIGGALVGNDREVYCVIFSPDGRTLASSSINGKIFLWDVAAQTPIGQPMYGQGPVEKITFSHDGKFLASISREGNIILWDLGTRRRLGSLSTGYQRSIQDVSFSPDGKTLATSQLAKDNTGYQIVLWDVNPTSWQARACRVANRNLTPAERSQYIGASAPYPPACADQR